MLNWVLIYVIAGLIAYLAMCVVGAVICTRIKIGWKYAVMREVSKLKSLKGIGYIAFNIVLWPVATVVAVIAQIATMKMYKNVL